MSFVQPRHLLLKKWPCSCLLECFKNTKTSNTSLCGPLISVNFFQGMNLRSLKGGHQNGYFALTDKPIAQFARAFVCTIAHQPPCSRTGSFEVHVVSFLTNWPAFFEKRVDIFSSALRRFYDRCNGLISIYFPKISPLDDSFTQYLSFFARKDQPGIVTFWRNKQENPYQLHVTLSA